MNEKYVMELTTCEVDEMHRYVTDSEFHEGLNVIAKENLIHVYNNLQQTLYHSRTSLQLIDRIRVIANL
ncbi:MAG: hypothetical protein ACE3JP_06260 [Ectobacillus sp.]